MAASRVPLIERVERGHERLVGSILRRVEVLPAYAGLPRSEFCGEVVPVLNHGLRTTFRLLHEGGVYTDDDLAVFRESAIRRAHKGVSLPDLLGAYHLGGQVLWQEFSSAATLDEHDELVRITSEAIGAQPVLFRSLVAAYLGERQRLAHDLSDSRRAVAAALVRGVPAEALAARAGVVLAASYLVIALRSSKPTDWAQRGGDLLQRLERLLTRIDSVDILGWLGHDGGFLFVPAAAIDVEGLALDLPQQLHSLTEQTGAPMTAAIAWRPTRGELPEAVQEAREVSQLAVAIGRPPGVYRLDDVLLESVLVQPSAVAERLIQLLTPLAEGSALRETLETYLGADLDRRRTARALHIHPNTLDYRLRRIQELTGLAPTTTHGLQLLGAALIAARLRGGTASGGPSTAAG